MREKKKVDIEVKIEDEKLEEKIKKRNTKKEKQEVVQEVKRKPNGILVFLTVITLVLGVINYGTIMNSISKLTNNYEVMIKETILLLVLVFFVIYSLIASSKNKEKKLVTFGNLFLIIYLGINLAINYNFIKLPMQDVMIDFKNKSLAEVVKWTSEKKIKLNQLYEVSDLVSEYNVISQDVNAGTLLKNVSELTIVISEGPNYEKEVIIPSFVGKSVDDVIDFVDKNFLIGVNIDFIESDEERDSILEQDKSGAIKRNDKVNMKASIGSLTEIAAMSMKDLKDEDLFHATTWLKRYGFKYEIENEYSNSIKKGHVISQSEKAGSEVDPNTTTIKLVVSKGPKIIVPNLKGMSVDKITEWIIANNLKVEFEETYDDSTELGKVIEVNLKEKDEIEQGTLVKVKISKGSLKMEKFTNIADFKAWAEKYEVLYTEEYEFNDSLSSGSIISTSLKEGETVKNNENIVVKVSQGKAVEIPSLVGKSKSEITKICSSTGIKCSFNYGGYNASVDKDVAVSQSKRSGSKVSSGTSVVVTLSSGKPQSYNVVIQSNWLSPGDADSTIKTLKSKLESACPGVTFKFEKKNVNTGIGLITQDSPVKGGANTFTQGKTYTIYVGK